VAEQLELGKKLEVGDDLLLWCPCLPPHDPNKMGDIWCVGWQNSGTQSKDGKDMFLLGDLVLSNKLVLYDLEKQAIGWTEYNCSSSIKVQDDKTGEVYSVVAHNISSAFRLPLGILVALCTIAAILHVLIW
ncbi:hypothetical protein Taro_022949, partial [Colocasia esculenta]|nr:hypothetical protein [Colocasia esculenta]